MDVAICLADEGSVSKNGLDGLTARTRRGLIPHPHILPEVRIPAERLPVDNCDDTAVLDKKISRG